VQKTVLASIAAVFVASSLIIVSQNYGTSASDPAPSDMQVTSVPKTATIPLQMSRASANFTEPAFNQTVWIPMRALSSQFFSEMVDVREYRTLSVMVSPSPARQVNSSDAVSLYASEVEKSLIGLRTFVTFVDPDTGASTTIQINKDTYSVPVAGPAVFVSIGFGNHYQTPDPDLMTVVMYLSS
jgi:hypothetical protein